MEFTPTIPASFPPTPTAGGKQPEHLVANPWQYKEVRAYSSKSKGRPSKLYSIVWMIEEKNQWQDHYLI